MSFDPDDNDSKHEVELSNDFYEQVVEITEMDLRIDDDNNKNEVREGVVTRNVKRSIEAKKVVTDVRKKSKVPSINARKRRKAPRTISSASGKFTCSKKVETEVNE